MLANNVAACLRVGPEFADSVTQWDEDRLNTDFVTDTTSGGQNSTDSQSNLLVSLADAAVVDIGSILADMSTTVGGVAQGEQVRVLAVNGQTVTVSRGYGGSTKTTHAQGAQWSIIGQPTIENSDLGRDKSRPRVRKINYVQRHEINVNLSSEVIMRSRRGYTPGIADELEYQFYQRTQEILRLWNKTLIYMKGDPGTTGTTGVSGGDYSTMFGLRAMLDGTFNSTSSVIDFAASYTAGQIDLAINKANKTLYRNGATPDWCLGGPNAAEDVGKLYDDRIRIQQDDTTRGFAAMYFRTSLANELRMLLDGFVQDGSPVGDLFVLDSGRIRIRPQADMFYYVITAETLRDGDAIRALSKMSLEVRNTGSDIGQAHQLIKNVSFSQG